MGVVYDAFDPLLNRRVAIKTVLRSAFGDPDTLSDTSARFVREAQAIARLSHPHIVTVFDFGEEGDVAYFVMEFVAGRELKSYFDAGEAFSLNEAVRIMGELLSALAFAHRNGVVHRDVKPANVMLDEAMRVKLTDFGVARMADVGGDRTLAGTMVGTPSYMSPEQLQGHAVGSRTDLFAAGIILYQFLTGIKPFPGPGIWALQKQIVQDTPRPPSHVNPAIDPRFDAVVFRALAKNPAERHADAIAFSNELAGLIGSSALGGSVAQTLRQMRSDRTSETQTAPSRPALDDGAAPQTQDPSATIAASFVSTPRTPTPAVRQRGSNQARVQDETQIVSVSSTPPDQHAHSPTSRDAASAPAPAEGRAPPAADLSATIAVAPVPPGTERGVAERVDGRASRPEGDAAPPVCSVPNHSDLTLALAAASAPQAMPESPAPAAARASPAYSGAARRAWGYAAVALVVVGGAIIALTIGMREHAPSASAPTTANIPVSRVLQSPSSDSGGSRGTATPNTDTAQTITQGVSPASPAAIPAMGASATSGPASPTTVEVPDKTASIKPGGAVGDSTLAPEAAPVERAAASKRADPMRPRVADQASASAMAGRKRVSDADASPVVRHAATTARCSDLLQRFQVGEDLPPDELNVLRKECRK
ncbi:MAG: protein kinase [Rhodocyclaceae bacterium]|nr:protein kinase [Rhodocyclaceae bacterium]MBX3668230.1 protein kinase [Rhodocyclaceae bacterium]